MDESGFQVLIEEAIGSIWASEMALFLFFVRYQTKSASQMGEKTDLNIGKTPDEFHETY
jgi:hypothetical protein